SRGRLRGQWLIEIFVNLPLVLPPVATGLILLIIFGREGLLGGLLDPLGIHFVFDWKGAVLASAVVSFPLLVRAVRLAFDAVDPGLPAMARSLGDGPWRAFARVELPLALPGVAAGATLALARCLGEFGATIVFAGNLPGATRTIPLAIYDLYETPDGLSRSWRLLGLSVVIAAGALVVSEILQRRGRCRLGRELGA
ncbi:MAG: molybdate ABC transporter permease subunit, partial [Planctomycetes bacterium]|nr:molybdate ABC transporter permease subunit [Planctomycetota bacterium]